MDVNDINEKFKRCITQWNNKLIGMGSGMTNGVRFMFEGRSHSDISGFIKDSDFYDEKYITDLIAYGNEVIQKLETITFKENPSRDEQNESMRNMREKVGEVKFPVNDKNERFDRGHEMIFLDFPLYSTSMGYSGWAPPYTSWRSDIPKMVIERINCYLDAFKSLIQYKQSNSSIEDPEEKYKQEPINDPEEKYNTSSRGGKKRTNRRRIGKKRTNKRKTNKRRKSKRRKV